jgi:hypothetical protein
MSHHKPLAALAAAAALAVAVPVTSAGAATYPLVANPTAAAATADLCTMLGSQAVGGPADGNPTLVGLLGLTSTQIGC